MWVFISSDKAGEGSWFLMSHLIRSIQKSLVALDMVLQELDMPVESLKLEDLDIVSASISIRGTSGMLQKLVQGLLERQQVLDLALAIKLGEA